MNPGQSRYPLRTRRVPRRLYLDPPSPEFDHEDSPLDKNRPDYMDPWIVNLLLEYNESKDRLETQYGQVLRVLKDADGQNPEAVVNISDGHHYIQTVIPARVIQKAKCFPPQSGFSSILGQFIVIKNFRVCVKEATKVEDSGFYLIVDCFHLTAMKRWAMRQPDCNQEPSVLQKLKELWLRGLSLRPLPSSEPLSVSEVVSEMKQDKLSNLKQKVADCLCSLDPINLMDSEKLSEYPDTKWQAERRQDKLQCRDIFTVPAKFLMINAEEEAAQSSSNLPKPSHIASDDESSLDGDPSTMSFVNEAETVDGSFENPWDIFPGMTMTSSQEMSDPQPSLPNAQPMLLASTAEEEEAASSSSCTPDGLQCFDPAPYCSSTQIEPMESTSQSLLPPCKEGANQESRSRASDATCNTSKISATGGSIPCGQPLNYSNSPAGVCGLSPVCPTIRRTLTSKISSGDAEESHPAHLQRETVVVRRAGKKSLATCRECRTAKRKLVSNEEGSVETSSRHKGQDLTSAVVKLSRLNGKQMAQKQPLEFVKESTPKKSRIEEIRVQHIQTSSQSRCAGKHLEKTKGQTVTTGRPTDSSGGQLGAKKQEHERRAVSHHVYQPASAELGSQVQSTRISRAQLGWARWVLRNGQRPQS
ncbi:adrenocortical dysplasia protein homolog isoform X2 [Sphaerodactylus townsendi]|uniref:adrenocortical dysplasia protein homolog isoform X2 n=1 Tax=Sphaerodactylus townsendi TaxID=933632 RepID=UPI0020263D90|nr:adrenocortical dysplasia protein homolog isoform X2 [Sphaerodactylus townsendi]